MRVALNGLFLSSPATGTGQYVRELVRAMMDLAGEFQFQFIAPQPDPTAPAPVRAARPLTARLNENLAKVEFEHLTFPLAARRARARLAHVPHFGPPLLPSLPTLVTIHDLIPLLLPDYRGSRLVQLYTALATRAARRARLVLADSEASAQDIQELLGIPPERVRVAYLAARDEFRPASLGEVARVARRYNLPPRFVLYLGGFDVRKNVGQVLRAFAGQEEARASGWKLVVAGRLPAVNSEFFPDLRLLAEQLGVADSVHWTGFVAEVDKPALYSAARAFVFPSKYEGFGLPPLEAMQCGTPVICSNRASLPEVVGDAGLLLDPSDLAAWTAALRRIIYDDALWGDLRTRGLEQARRFSWARTARETLEAYREVAT